jgi:HK97 family phage major capsid protein
MTPAELRKEKAAKIQQARGIYDKIKGENRDPSPEEATQVDALIAEAESFETKAVGAEQWAMIDQRMADMGQSAGRTADPLPHEDPTNTRKGRHQYSVLKAIREACYDVRGRHLTGLEKECHDEMVKDRQSYNLPGPRGVLVPNNLGVDVHAANRWAEASGVSNRFGRSASFSLDTAAGAGSIPTIIDQTMIELLRARMVTTAMGARTMENMQGLFAIPRQSGPGTFYWVTQGNSVTPSNQTIDQVPFSPHTGGAQTAYTRQFIEQTNQAAEAFIRADHIAIIARGYESAALNGPGSGGSPLGILQNPLIPTISAGTNGGAPTWTNVVQLESTIAEANADMGSLGYITDASMRGTLKTTLKIGTTFPIYIWDTMNSARPLNDYPVGVTNLLPGNLTSGSGTSLHALLYGNWNDMFYAFWSGYDTIVDPYTQAGAGSVVITVLQDGDVNVRHPESFAKMPNLITTQ